jgi:biotin synthase
MNSPTTVSQTVDFEALADKSLRGEALSHEEALRVLDAPSSEMDALLAAARRVREAHFGRRVKVCVLLNAQSGICPEDCNYCSQSKISKAEVEKYKLLPEDTIVERAHTAAATGAKRFCIVIAARGPAAERHRPSVERGAPHQRRRGDAAHGNLHQPRFDESGAVPDTQRSRCRLRQSQPEHQRKPLRKICSTHTYADRVSTLHNVQEAGLKTCSGGIVGMGETNDDIVQMGLKLREMDIESIPINFLLTIPARRCRA